MVTLTDADLPALHRDSDAASLAAQQQFLRATASTLLFSVGAAVFGAVEADWAGFCAAACFVGALAGSFVLLKSNPERVWYDGRAVAESTKTLAWQYAVGGGDFPRTAGSPGSDEERETDARFVAALGEVRRGLSDVAPVPQGPVEPLTPAMRQLRSNPLEDRRAAYLADRIGDQSAWYGRKSRDNDSQRRVWSWLSAVVQAVGFLGALAKGAGLVHFDMLGIAAAAAIAAAAWLRAKDYAELARAYAIAASELGDVRVTLDAARTESEWALAVRDAEIAISREHTRWAARRHLRRVASP